MRLTVVGCSGSFPGPDSAASCYLLEADGFKLVIDLGNGALGGLQRHLDVNDVDAVFISHLHADHCLDLCPYYVARKYRPEGPLDRIPVYGPAGTAEHVARAYGLHGGTGMGEIFDFRTLAGDSSGRPVAVPDIGPFTISVGWMNHPIETLGIRLEYGGRSIAYSADTGESATLVALARDVDLMLCEAAFHEGRDTTPDLHLTGQQAGQHAAAAGAGHLLLTHLPPWNSPERSHTEATGAFDGTVSLAAAGLTYDVR